MPAAPSSLTDPAVGQLLTAAHALGIGRARCAVPGRHPGPAADEGCVTGWQSSWAGRDARCWPAPLVHRDRGTGCGRDQGTREAPRVTGVVPRESRFRRTLPNLDADALDEAVGAWARIAHRAGAPGARRVIAVNGKTLRGSGTAHPQIAGPPSSAARAAPAAPRSAGTPPRQGLWTPGRLRSIDMRGWQLAGYRSFVTFCYRRVPRPTRKGIASWATVSAPGSPPCVWRSLRLAVSTSFGPTYYFDSAPPGLSLLWPGRDCSTLIWPRLGVRG